ncbi:ankyrin unc44 [Colletotrichum tofieldiae]|nr:ankyrin unc44 [Colletotrichum tofieldiae]GKT81934.1 ankyrin unc44 [Colletotrichum tofieldiae]
MSIPTRLPNDVLLQIVQVCAAPASPDFIPTLASICLANKFLYAVARPLIFRAAASRDHIHIDSPVNISPDAYTPPLVLWAASRGRLDVLRHISATFRIPAHMCQDHWPWARGDLTLAAGSATALHFACRNGHRATARWLLEHGAQVNQLSYHNCLCPSKHLRLLDVIDPGDAPSATPLALAIAHKQEEIAYLLIAHGARWVNDDADDEDEDHGDGYDANIAAFLARRSAQLSSSLSIAVANGMHRLISWLHKFHPTEFRQAARIYDSHGFNALHYVVCHDDPVPSLDEAPNATPLAVVLATVTTLCAAGFDPAAKLPHRFHDASDDAVCELSGGCTVTPLQLAREWKKPRIASLLADAAAQRNK